MKLLFFINNYNQPSLGLLTARGILDIEAWYTSVNGRTPAGDHYFQDQWENLKAVAENENLKQSFYLKEDEIVMTACVNRPSKIICIGLNYRRHAMESNMPLPESPVVFNKFNNTLINYKQEVSLGNVGEQFDYEVELGVVIGKKCKNISKQHALEYVLGYCVANDLSCRDLQFRSSQWLLGKSLDGFLPLGKNLVTADEIPDPQNLNLSCWVNGELRQQSNTSDMIFSVAEIIEDLSRHMTLEPGDLILTGTPEGVIMGKKEKNWLKPGDIVKVEIEKLGTTENRMIR